MLGAQAQDKPREVRSPSGDGQAKRGIGVRIRSGREGLEKHTQEEVDVGKARRESQNEP
jgi:hypothetical protein